MFETRKDHDLVPDDDLNTRRQFLRRLGTGFGALGLASMSSPVMGFTEAAKAAASAQVLADAEQDYMDRLNRETEERLMRMLKREMIRRGEEISESSLKHTGCPDDFVRRFLALEVEPNDAGVA